MMRSIGLSFYMLKDDQQMCARMDVLGVHIECAHWGNQSVASNRS